MGSSRTLAFKRRRAVSTMRSWSKPRVGSSATGNQATYSASLAARTAWSVSFTKA